MANYSNLNAVSRTLATYGKIAKVLGVLVGIGGLAYFFVGVGAEHRSEGAFQQLGGTIAFLAGLGLHGAGIVIAAAGEVLLALSDSARANAQIEANTTEMVRLLRTLGQ